MEGGGGKYRGSNATKKQVALSPCAYSLGHGVLKQKDTMLALTSFPPSFPPTSFKTSQVVPRVLINTHPN